MNNSLKEALGTIDPSQTRSERPDLCFRKGDLLAIGRMGWRGERLEGKETIALSILSLKAKNA